MTRAPRTLLTLVLPTLVLGLLGCQSVPRDAGFGDVKQDVSTRIGKEIRWNRNSAEDCASADAIQKIVSKELTPDDAVQIALLNNRKLQATYESLGVAQADLVQAGLFRNPRFLGNYLPATGGGSSAIVGLDLAINFLDLFYIPLRKRIAEAQFVEARRLVAADVLAVAGNTRVACYNLQCAQQLLELHQTVLQAMGASAYAMEKLHDAGNVTGMALEQERDTRDQAKLELAKAEAMVVQAREQLNRLMGLWGKQAEYWQIQKRMAELPALENPSAELEKNVLQASLLLAANRERLEALARQAGFSKWESVLPEVEMGPSADREDDGVWHPGPVFALTLPLFDQGQARHAAVKARFRMAIERHAELAVEVRSLARTAWHKVETAHATAQFLKKVVLPRRTRIMDGMQKEYNAIVPSQRIWRFSL